MRYGILMGHLLRVAREWEEGMSETAKSGIEIERNLKPRIGRETWRAWWSAGRVTDETLVLHP